jgi:hypothetical protein
MTKTSTSNHIVNFQNTPVQEAVDEGQQQDALFYNSIKPQLNELIKDPSDEIISNILAYSKKKK